MALTLAEAAKLSNDVLVRGVMEEVVTDSEILQVLPFIEIVGNALTYNRENTLGTASFFSVNDTWTESTPTFTQVSTSLTIVGQFADVDNYVRQTRSNVQDIEAEVLRLAAKSVQRKFENAFVNGTGTAPEFPGLDNLVTSAQTIFANGATAGNGATLTLAIMDRLIDQVKGRKPDLLLMSKRSRRKLKGLRQSSGNILEVERDQFGRMVTYYDAIPIAVSDWISDAQTAGGSNDCSVIYALSLGEGALAGLTNGGIQIERIGSLETKDASRHRIKWYVAVALFSTVSCARVTGVRD